MKAPYGKTYEVSAWIKSGAEALLGVQNSIPILGSLKLQQLFKSSHS